MKLPMNRYFQHTYTYVHKTRVDLQNIGFIWLYYLLVKRLEGQWKKGGAMEIRRTNGKLEEQWKTEEQWKAEEQRNNRAVEKRCSSANTEEQWKNGATMVKQRNPGKQMSTGKA